MRVRDVAGNETEAFGPCLMERLGEVFILNGAVLGAADMLIKFAPQPERRLADRRLGQRRKNRTHAGRRQHKRRMRDALNLAKWQTVIARERVLMLRLLAGK
jgi:hypothetical protein